MSVLGCVIQGSIRRGFEEVLDAISRLFPKVIVSTWQSESFKLPRGNFDLVTAVPPECKGIGNRNLQRFGVFQGIRAAKALGCTHVLRWRTDLLPTRLSTAELLALSQKDVPPGLDSRIVLSAWRNLSMAPDWFSSLPDLFMFADINAMERLWSTEGMNLTLPVNFPPEMIEELRLTFDVDRNELNLCGNTYKLNQVYDTHIEFYAWFRSRLQSHLRRQLDHPTIALNALRLVDHRKFGVCWFKDSSELAFRSIENAVEYDWWKEKNWKRLQQPSTVQVGWPVQRPKLFWKVMNWSTLRYERYLQKRWYQSYIETPKKRESSVSS